jgi:hypothetical protein
MKPILDIQRQKYKVLRAYQQLECYLTREQANQCIRDLNDGEKGLERVANLVSSLVLKYEVRLN